ncbi:MAG: oligosaccharide flippase family protein [Patescibacteria group bacterium]
MDSLSQRTFKNALWQVFNLGWVTLLNFFVTPLLLKQIGIENYGVYILILTIVSFLSLLDLNMGSGFASSFIEYTVNQEKEKKVKLVNSFFSFWLAIGLIGFLVLIGLSFLADFVFSIRTEFIRQTQFGFWFAGIYFVFATINSLFFVISISIQRFDILGKITFIQNTVLNAFLIGFAFFRPSLTWLLASHFFSAVISLFGYFVLIKKVLPELKLKLEFYRTEFFRKLKFSLYNFINGFAGNSLLQIDRFFISRILGNAAVGFYAVPNNLAQKIHAVSSSGAMTLFPVASDLFYQGDKQKFNQSFRRAMRIGIIFSVLSGVVLLVFGYQLLYFWVGKEIADKSAALLYYFVPTYILMSIYTILNNFYLGTGKSKLLAVFSGSMALVNIVLLAFLVPNFGLTGAALAYLLALMPVILFVFLFERKELNLSGSFRFYFGLILKLLFVSAILVLLARFYLLSWANNLWQTLLLMIVSFAGIIGLYFVFGFFEPEDRELIRNYLKLWREKNS